MCELFGFTSVVPMDIHSSLKIFFSHSLTNPDGYGIKVFGDKGFEMREPVRAIDSRKLMKRIENKVTCETAIAHIRFATHGKNKKDNCHPFSLKDSTGRQWTLAHNGFIQNNSFMDTIESIQKGETDSERILYFIVSYVDMMLSIFRKRSKSKEELTERDRIAIVDAALEEVSKLGKVNLLIYDGELLYVYSNAYGTLNYLKDEKYVLFSTKPLFKSTWKSVPGSSLQVYKNTELIYQGKVHEKFLYTPIKTTQIKTIDLTKSKSSSIKSSAETVKVRKKGSDKITSLPSAQHSLTWAEDGWDYKNCKDWSFDPYDKEFDDIWDDYSVFDEKKYR